jgi:hypothetical protein
MIEKIIDGERAPCCHEELKKEMPIAQLSVDWQKKRGSRQLKIIKNLRNLRKGQIALKSLRHTSRFFLSPYNMYPRQLFSLPAA